MYKYDCYGCKHKGEEEQDSPCRRCGNYVMAPDCESMMFVKDKWEGK